MVAVESKELEDFVRSTIESIEKGLKEGYGVGDIEFELAVVKIKKGKGGIRVFVVDASGEYGKENISKIKFRVNPPFPETGAINLWQE